jgi:hypothetical protein
MEEQVPSTFMYEHCDVPQGVSLAEWRTRAVPAGRRRAQVTSGMLAAVATLTPLVLSVRGIRHRR